MNYFDFGPMVQEMFKEKVYQVLLINISTVLPAKSDSGVMFCL